MKIFGYEVAKAKDKPKEGEMNPEEVSRILSTLVNPWETGPGKEIFHQEDYHKLVNAYKSWIYICANKNATAVAESPLRLYVSKPSKESKVLTKSHKIDKTTIKRLTRKAGITNYITKAAEVEEIEEHPFLDMLKNVNPLINRFDLWELTQIWLELTGNAFWYVYKDNLGVPAQVWPLPPQFVRIVISPDKIVAGYVFQRTVQKIPFDETEIIHFKFGSPQGTLYGTGPLTAIMDTNIADQNIRIFESTLMKNQGRPEGILETMATVPEETFKRLKEQWRNNYGGANKVGKTLILENGLTYKPLTFTPREMNYVVGRKMNREEIAAAFGIPMSKLTTEAVNLANAYVGEHQYMQDTIEPRLRRIEEKLNEKLMPMYDENLFIAYDEVIPADKEYTLRERQANLGSFVTTINEERENLGMDAVEWGDVPLAQTGIGPLGSQAAAPGMPPGVVPGVLPEEPVLPENPIAEVGTKKDIEDFIENVLNGVKIKMLEKKEMSKEDWIQAWKDDPHWDKDKPSNLVKRLLKDKDPKGLYILEIGCGNGVDSIAFGKEGCKVVGIDISPEAIDVAKGNNDLKNVKFQVGDAENLTFKDSQFDLVYSMAVLHSSDLKKSISEVSRVLKDDGEAMLFLYQKTLHDSGEKEVDFKYGEIEKIFKDNDFTVKDKKTGTTEDKDEEGNHIHHWVTYFLRKG